MIHCGGVLKEKFILYVTLRMRERNHHGSEMKEMEY
jgi:hypothetical protein